MEMEEGDVLAEFFHFWFNRRLESLQTDKEAADVVQPAESERFAEVFERANKCSRVLDEVWLQQGKGTE